MQFLQFYCIIVYLFYKVFYLQVVKLILKACVCYFNILPQKKALKNCKNAFYFTKKAIFVLEIFKFLYFSLPYFFLLLAITEFIGNAD